MAVAPVVHGVCAAGNTSASAPDSTPTTDFADNGDGTITHSNTGLIWKRCAEGQTWSGVTCTGTSLTYDWQGALLAAASSSHAGYLDWRLPNDKELHSIVETCGYSPAINLSLFPATPPAQFWSSSTYVNSPSLA